MRNVTQQGGKLLALHFPCVGAIDRYTPCQRLEDACNAFHQRGFAGAVGAGNAYDVPLGYFQGNVLEYGVRAISKCQIMHP